MAIEAARLYVRIGADIGEAQKGISTVSRAVGGMGDIARTALGFFGGQVMMDAVRGLGNMAREAIGATAQFQMLQAGLTSLMAREMVAGGQFKNVSAALDTAGESAKGMLEELAKIAMVSPYQMETVAGTYRLAMAFGYSAEEAKGFTSAILNVAAGTGATNEMLDRMAYNFAQIRLQGKVTAVDIRQLALAGFDLNGVLKYVGKQMGINIENHEDFNRALDSGKITWKQFNQLFEKYAKENFGGASERMSRTLEGLKSTFKDVFALTMPKLLGPAAEVFTKFAGGILDDFMKIRDSGVLDDVGASLGGFMERLLSGGWLTGIPEKITESMGNLAAAIRDNAPMVKDAFAEMWGFMVEQAKISAPALTENVSNAINQIAELWRAHGDEIMAVVGGAWNIVVTTVTGALTILTGVISANLTWINGLIDTFSLILQGQWWQALGMLATTAQETFTIILTTIETFANQALALVGSNLTTLRAVWSSNWEMFKTIVVQVLENTKAIIEGIIDEIVNNVEGQMRSMLSALQSAVQRAGELAKGINFGGGTGGWQIPSGGGGKPSVWMSGERAAGGPVIAGRSYLVGEEGPEMFTPRQSGQIVPNDRLGQSVTINGPIYITAESGDTLGGLLGSIQLLGA